MPLTNGDLNGSSPSALHTHQPLDHTRALDILKEKYPQKDGLDARTLLASSKHGALTYNDFLVLPGYIGVSSPHHNKLSLTFSRLCRIRSTVRLPGNKTHLPQDATLVFANGHRHRAFNGDTHGFTRWTRGYPPQLLGRGSG